MVRKRKRKRPPLWFEEQYDTMRKMEEEFHRTMRDMWRDPFEFRFRFPRMRFPKTLTRTIKVYFGETEKELLVRAELPGFSKDEIKLKITPFTIDISAEKKKKRIEQEEKYFRKEISYGSARRVVRLPVEVDTEETHAKFEHGILKIVLRKKKPVKRKEKKIKIE